MKAKRNQRAWDADDEPRTIDKLPPTPRKKFKRLSREIMDRAESNRANGSAVPFYELEEWAKWARKMEVQLLSCVRFFEVVGSTHDAGKLKAAISRSNGKAKR